MMKGCLVYATRYGSTAQVAQWIAAEIRRHAVALREAGQAAASTADFYILGTPIFIGKPAREMTEYIQRNKAALCDKPVFVFITSWAQSTAYSDACHRFIDGMAQELYPCLPVLVRSLSGKLLWAEMTPRDRRIMTRLLRRIDARAPDFHAADIRWEDKRDEDSCRRFGRAIEAWLQTKGGAENG